MLLLSGSDISHGYSATPLFEDVNFEVMAGDRVGFVGPNGAGKTTLLKIIAGELDPDSGAITLHAGARLGVLQQVAEFPPGRTVFEEAKSAFDELLQAQQDLVAVAERLSVAADEIERKQLSDKFDRLSEQLSTEDAYQLDHKVEDVLDGLGFKPADYDRAITTFSGWSATAIVTRQIVIKRARCHAIR